MLDRKHPPPFVKSTSLKLPATQRLELPNGVEVYSVDSTPTGKTIKIEAISDSGKWYESMPGVAHFTAQLLEKGTASKSSVEIAEFFERHGASLEINSGSDYTSVSLYTLDKHLDRVLPALLEVLSQPSFPDNELDLLKNIFLQSLKVNNEKTSYVSSKILRRNVFSNNHPYGRPVEEEDVRIITRLELENYFNKYFNFNKVFVTGSLTDITYKHLSTLLPTTPPELISTENREGNGFEQSHEIIDRPKSVQSSIRLGRKTVLRNHPDFFKILILNHYLGGYFGSQLMKNLREEKGLTYGISSSVNSFRHDGFMVIGTDVNKENREFALSEIRKELKLMRNGNFNAEYLELAKRHFIGSLQTEVANPFSILNKIKNIVLNDLPENHYQSMITAIDQLRPDELLEPSESYFHEDTFHDVIVG
jgi:predicted Zn-dependent peptidase